jgi:CheY-like chemotaxis protein
MTPNPAGPRLSVLVVDDNRDAADTLALFLRLKGHDARAAYAGEEAAAILADWPADVAVLDIVMSGLGGVELAARLRETAARPIMLIALTGIGTNDGVAPVKAGAFDHFFLKPVDPDKLLGLLTGHAHPRPH